MMLTESEEDCEIEQREILREREGERERKKGMLKEGTR